jgi:hypothetical protein
MRGGAGCEGKPRGKRGEAGAGGGEERDGRSWYLCHCMSLGQAWVNSSRGGLWARRTTHGEEK